MLFCDAIIDLFTVKLDTWFISNAKLGFLGLQNYVGDAYLYNWREYSVHIKIINVS